MQNIRESILLKFLSYILIPVMIFILSISFVNVLITSQYGEMEEPEEYIETEEFGREYLSTLIDKVQYIKKDKIQIEENAKNINTSETSEMESDSTSSSTNTDQNTETSFEIEKDNIYENYNEIDDESYEYPVYYETIHYNNTRLSTYINYIIIDKQNGNLFTNIQCNNYSEEINKLKTEKTNWSYQDGNITTNIDRINQENTKYITSSYYAVDNLEGYDVYSNIDPSNLNYSNSLYVRKTVYNLFKGHENLPTYLIPLSAISVIFMIVYLVWSTGHEKGKEGIQINSIDRISYEVISIGIMLVIGMMISFAIASIESQIPQRILISVFLLCYLIGYACLAVWVSTTIRRLKAKQFIRSFLTYKVCRWIKITIEKIFRKITDKENVNRKITIIYWGFVFISIILACTFWSGIGFFILIAFWVWTYYKLLQYNKKLQKINEALRNIYDGNPNVKLNEEELEGTLKIMAKYINDIAGGFTNAIEQSLKSERLKTELITNVSHDIKTPLTSIINYVDLLKKEDIKNAQIEQYIAVLDKKSQRLKKLIEDLVEASKVSSGNVKLNMEVINLKELLNQTMGEFEDKLEKKNLKMEMDLPNENVLIKADNRYLYRVIENIFSNISKYALEGSRVYIKLEKQKEEVYLEFKNISKEKLNISAEELMQRFVRGDKSRYTEGSGLGLSIAESLTELQGGKFKIDIDGDLFKVEISWKEV